MQNAAKSSSLMFYILDRLAAEKMKISRGWLLKGLVLGWHPGLGQSEVPLHHMPLSAPLAPRPGSVEETSSHKRQLSKLWSLYPKDCCGPLLLRNVTLLASLTWHCFRLGMGISWLGWYNEAILYSQPGSVSSGTARLWKTGKNMENPDYQHLC